eukprot:scaffold200691_cov33-Tisochrysis_lutea.AAC.8
MPTAALRQWMRTSTSSQSLPTRIAERRQACRETSSPASSLCPASRSVASESHPKSESPCESASVLEHGFHRSATFQARSSVPPPECHPPDGSTATVHESRSVRKGEVQQSPKLER